MGVPALYRWLSKKYASINVHAVQERPKEVDGEKVYPDSSAPNPNDVEFDNLYLDMNGIIHPCSHPEHGPQPESEEEMMINIFNYIDMLFNIVRPRRLLYMAIDGIAPRAKMNQQRSRRFRAAKESREMREEYERVRQRIVDMGGRLPAEKRSGFHFDSNCITPGTPFMHRLSVRLRFYVMVKLNTDPGWKQVKVVFSDANYPGEGEHKIMDYIRKQRNQAGHDANTKHCLYGADADLIMLGLATHEPHFTILREEVKPWQEPACKMCKQRGHDLKDCTGLDADVTEADAAAADSGDNYSLNPEFTFIRLNILKEYLEMELNMQSVPFKYDFERTVDDWVMLCFFVGNDFLPHLPSLEIREGGIDKLVNIYKRTVVKSGGYLTDSGVVNMKRVQMILLDLGEMEDEIFKKRQQREAVFQSKAKDRKKWQKQLKKLKNNKDKPSFVAEGQFAPQALGGGGGVVSNPRQAAYQGRMQAMNYSSAAQSGGKRSSSEMNDSSDSDDEPYDEVRLWESGWKDRYYTSKFNMDKEDYYFRMKISHAYSRGLCWVLRYYYQGCASWKWYFPYNYAPFASDFKNIEDLPNDFPTNTKPIKPMEQLMSVFPAASGQHLPPTWRELMSDPDSTIIDFYPTNFKVDLNGKKAAWMGVALLPFIDEGRLNRALEKVYPDLTEEEKKRNRIGNNQIFISNEHPLYKFFVSVYTDNLNDGKPVAINTELSQGMGGSVQSWEDVLMPGGTLPTPLKEYAADITDNKCIGIHFFDPEYPEGFLFPSKRLPNAKDPEKVVKQADIGGRAQLGFQRDSFRSNRPAYSMDAAKRMIGSSNPSNRDGYHNRSQSAPGSSNGMYRDRHDRGGYGQSQYGNSGQSLMGGYHGGSGGGGGGGGPWHNQMAPPHGGNYMGGYNHPGGAMHQQQQGGQYSRQQRPPYNPPYNAYPSQQGGSNWAQQGRGGYNNDGRYRR